MPFFCVCWKIVMDLALIELLGRAVAASGLSYWGSEWVNDSGHRLLRVYVELKDNSCVTADDCVLATKQIKALLNVEAVIDYDYSLEVSSPGIDRRLFCFEHYVRCLNQVVKCKLKRKQDGYRVVLGELIAAEEGEVKVVMNGKEWVLAVADIDKINLVG